MSKYLTLTIEQIRALTDDAVAITFRTEPRNFRAGQYITLLCEIDGKEHRRSYSVSRYNASQGMLEIGVKRVKNGLVSNFIHDHFKSGMTVQSLPPEGNFVLSNASDADTLHVFFAAGSGITPIMSMLREILENRQNKALLFFGNRSKSGSMYREQLLEWSENERFTLVEIFSDRSTQLPLTSGRIDFDKTLQLHRDFLNTNNPREYYICGPSGMMQSVQNALGDLGVRKEKVHLEYFVPPGTEQEEKSAPPAEKVEEVAFSGSAKVTIVLDDDETVIDVEAGGDSILDSALDQGIDPPFSCKGGVCTSCKARIISGKVTMDSNYALTDDEIEEGYILTCQSHPATDELSITYDD